jgi:hypothetical protein
LPAKKPRSRLQRKLSPVAPAKELVAGKKRVLVLYHCASGDFSSDAAIYVEYKAVWRLVAYYAPLLNDSIEASAKDSTVVLKASQRKEVLFTVAITSTP